MQEFSLSFIHAEVAQECRLSKATLLCWIGPLALYGPAHYQAYEMLEVDIFLNDDIRFNDLIHGSVESNLLPEL